MEKEIIQIVSTYRQVDAIYVEGDEKNYKLLRRPVILFALYREYDPQKYEELGESRFISPLDSGEFICPVDFFDNYLGLEFDGKNENWDEEIKRYFVKENPKKINKKI